MPQIRNKSLKNTNDQRRFMEKLFHTCKYTTFEDWNTLTRTAILHRGGKTILTVYANNIPLLLRSIYPNYPFVFGESSKITIPRAHLANLDNQRNFMMNLGKKLNVQQVEDWMWIEKSKITAVRGGRSLLRYYNNDLRSLLASVFPNCNNNNNSNNENNINNELNVNINNENEEGILHQWQRRMKWKIMRRQQNLNASNFKELSQQRQFMDHQFQRFGLLEIGEWAEIARSAFIENGGFRLLRIYRNDWLKLLSTIYPNYPWDCNRIFFARVQSPWFFRSMDRQRAFMDQLFDKEGLISMREKMNISKIKILRSGGYHLLSQYSNNVQELLIAVYPEISWPFEYYQMRSLKNDDVSHRTVVRYLGKKYSVRWKSDWYRLPIKNNSLNVNILRLLRIVYPKEEWFETQFYSRAKKSKQLMVYHAARNTFPSLMLIEDYRHPLIFGTCGRMELDIFIPSLNVAFEYQGEQHYQDMPDCFSFVECYQSRDSLKEKLANVHQIQLFKIPFWWDSDLTPYLSIKLQFT